MDSEAFRKYGKEMVDIVADFWDSLEQRKPLPDVKPGYIWDLVPKEAPADGQEWQSIFADLERVIFQGSTNWHSPHFHAYYPTACSYPAIMGDILSGGIAAIGFTWKSSPCMTELEMAMTDWLARAVGLPEHFLNSHPGPGAGIIQSTASDATLVALLSARARAVRRLKEAEEKASQIAPTNYLHSYMSGLVSRGRGALGKRLLNLPARAQTPTRNGVLPSDTNAVGIEPPHVFDDHDPAYFPKLVAYCSDQAHSSIDKGVMLSGVCMRKLRSHRTTASSVAPALNGNFTVGANTLEEAIKEDRKLGYVPFICIATIGTTNTCGVDSLEELGKICAREGIWLHVDAAYAGSFLVCDEFRYMTRGGLDYVDSFNFNAHKAMMVNFDCSPMWFKDAAEAISYFNVDPTYLKHEHQEVASDYRHLQVALGRRLRALKIWFVMRHFGTRHLQAWLRKQVDLAELFSRLIVGEVGDDGQPLFELFVPQHLGLVCFKLKGASNEMNERLTAAINDDGRLHLVQATAHDTHFLRFAVCSTKTTPDDVTMAPRVISAVARHLLAQSAPAAEMNNH